MADVLGHDEKGGHLFRWDGEFHYDGRVAAPFCPIVPDSRARARVAGATFLSGVGGLSVCLDVSGLEITLWFVSWGVLGFAARRIDELSVLSIPTAMPVVVCGDVCLDPDRMRRVCRAYPAHWLKACPLVDGLEAFGALVEHVAAEKAERPRALSLMEPAEGDLQGEFQEFDQELGSDGLGRMAHLVAKGRPVLNQMMAGPCIRRFNGSVVARSGDGVWLTTSREAQRMFPMEPVSLKAHAARQVPVMVEPTAEFREATGFDGDQVAILVASDSMPGSEVFLRMYFPYSGRKSVCLLDPKSPEAPRNAPVFRYNKGWRLDEARYREVVDGGPSDFLRRVRDAGGAAAGELEGCAAGGAS